jgi:hypothetical protein
VSTDIIASCRDGIERLATGEATQDQFLMAQEFVAKLGEVYRELKERLEAASILYVEANGPVSDGVRRYYVAPNKTVKCTNVRGACEAILEVTGGDWDALADCFSTGALKPAKSKEVLGDRAREFFETTETKDLKTGDAGAKRLQVADSRYGGKK